MSQDPKPRPEGAEDLRDRFESVAPVILVDPEPVVRRGRRRRAVARAGMGAGAVAAVAVAAVAVGLVPGVGGSTTGPAGPPPPEPDRPVAVQVVPAVVEPGNVVTAVLVANEENDLTFGVAAEVDRWDGNEWHPAGVTGLCLVEWECVATVTDRLDAAPDIGLSATTPGVNGPATVLSTEGLADGWYRLVQRAALDEGVATGVFEVRTGATAGPPLPEPGDVRLVVDPRVVPPGGGLVTVTTVVPPDEQGNLTAEDIREVDDVLDPVALLHRWDGTQWHDVAELPVRDRDPGLGVEWGSPVVLPVLEEGSYRLVRRGTGGHSPWGVFTVTPGAPALEQPEPDGPAPGPDPDGAADGDVFEEGP